MELAQVGDGAKDLIDRPVPTGAPTGERYSEQYALERDDHSAVSLDPVRWDARRVRCNCHIAWCLGAQHSDRLLR